MDEQIHDAALEVFLVIWSSIFSTMYARLIGHPVNDVVVCADIESAKALIAKQMHERSLYEIEPVYVPSHELTMEWSIIVEDLREPYGRSPMAIVGAGMYRDTIPVCVGKIRRARVITSDVNFLELVAVGKRLPQSSLNVVMDYAKGLL